MKGQIVDKMKIIDKINLEYHLFYRKNYCRYPTKLYLGAKEVESVLSYIAETMKKPKELLDKDGEMCIFGMEIIEVAKMNHFNVTI